MAFEDFRRFESHYVDAGGIRTHYLDEGEGRPLVLVHGGGAGADGRANFADTMDFYAKHFRVIVPDMVGFGLTDQPDPESFEYSQQARTRHMVAFLEALDLTSVLIVGNSMGGTTAMGVAVDRPDLVAKLCLMSGAANVTAEDMARNRQNTGSLTAYDDTLEGMRRLIATLTYRFDPPDEFVQYRYEMSIRPAAKAAYRSTMAWAARNGLYFPEEAFRSLPMPTLVIAGRNDTMVPLERNFEMISIIPDCRGYIMSQCGHWCMAEHPREFCEVTTAFFLR